MFFIMHVRASSGKSDCCAHATPKPAARRRLDDGGTGDEPSQSRQKRYCHAVRLSAIDTGA
jgi:hypothetical protein